MVVSLIAALLASAAPASAPLTSHPTPPPLPAKNEGVAAAPPDISGHWSSLEPEPQGGLYVLRDFAISPTGWRVHYRAFADADARKPLFSLHVTGVYRLGGPSASTRGAYRGIFPAVSREITAESDAGVAMFQAMGCALTVGQARDLADTGCGFVPALMDAMGEYDLVALKEGQLFFGDRSGDLTKARPTALYPFPLVRR